MTASSFEERLTKLERENRRIKRAGLMLSCALGALLLTGYARPQKILSASSNTLEAGKLVIRDAQGRSRVEIGPEDLLALRGPDGKFEAVLSARPGTPALILSGPDGKSGAMLSALSSGPDLTLTGPDGKSSAILSARVPEESAAPGLPHLVLSLPGGTSATLSAMPGGAAFDLSGPDGKPAAALFTFNDGASLRLNDPSGFRSVLGVLDHTTSAASLRMFDNKKNLIWRAPEH